MKRKIVFSQQIQTVDQALYDERYAMVALSKLAQAVLGTDTLLSDLPCTATSPASLNVDIGPGQIYRMVATDATDYGSITADTTQILKQGLLETTTAKSCPAPVTVGHSINYLIQFTLTEQDVDSYVANYFNAANPSSPLNGPGNSGASQYKYRECKCIVGVKAGTSATTGTQTTPSPDAGYVGGYVVTVAYGQTTITGSNISTYASAPFISETLTDKMSQATADGLYASVVSVQNQTKTYAVDSGAANAYVAAISPAPASLVAGLRVSIKITTANTGASTLALNGFPAKSVIHRDGTSLSANDLPAGGIADFEYDGTNFQLQSPVNNSVYVPVRQTVLAAHTDTSGVEDYIAIGSGLSVTVNGGTTALVLTAAGGCNTFGSVDRVGRVTTNVTVGSLSANTTNYIYAEIDGTGAVTFGSTTLKPTYQLAGSYSTTSGQYVFNIQDMIGKVGNGSAANQVFRVFIGQAVTGASTVTSVVSYAIRCRYVSADTSFAINNKYTFSPNIGYPDYEFDLMLVNTSTDVNYPVGAIIKVAATNWDGTVDRGIIPWAEDEIVMHVSTGNNPPFLSNANGGSGGSLTASKWKLRVHAQRAW